MRIMARCIFGGALAVALCLVSFAAEDSDASTLFIVGETAGQIGIFAEKGKPLKDPKFDSDKVSNSQFIQVAKNKDGTKRYLLVTNSGSSEVALQIVGNALVFVSISENMHSTLTICLDRKFDDGAFLVIETMVRPDAFGSGSTLGRIFHGKAKPSPVFNSLLREMAEK